jgi:hypothetical protein
MCTSVVLLLTLYSSPGTAFMVARHQAARPAGRPPAPPRGSVLLAEGKEEGKEEGRSFSLPSLSLSSLLPVAFGFVALRVNRSLRRES